MDEKIPVIALAPEDSLVEKLLSNLEEVKARGGNLIIITNESNNELDDFSDIIIKIPEVKEYLYPFLTIIPLQLMTQLLNRLKV